MYVINSSLTTAPARMARSRRLIWLAIALFAITLLSAGCGRRPVAPEVDMTPAAGSVEAPADDAGDAGAADVSASSDVAGDAGAAEKDALDENAAPEEAGPAFAAGDQAIIVAIEGASVRSDAGEDAPVMQLYPMGDLVTVLRPSGDYDGYPVVVDGMEWIRVRAADGLVGWVAAATIEAAE